MRPATVAAASASESRPVSDMDMLSAEVDVRRHDDDDDDDGNDAVSVEELEVAARSRSWLASATAASAADLSLIEVAKCDWALRRREPPPKLSHWAHEASEDDEANVEASVAAEAFEELRLLVLALALSWLLASSHTCCSCMWSKYSTSWMKNSKLFNVGVSLSLSLVEKEEEREAWRLRSQRRALSARLMSSVAKYSAVSSTFIASQLKRRVRALTAPVAAAVVAVVSDVDVAAEETDSGDTDGGGEATRFGVTVGSSLLLMVSIEVA